MKIRNIITTSALVVLLGLTGGSAYADDWGDNDSHAPGSAVSVLVSDAGSNASAAEIAATNSNDAIAEFESFLENEIPVSDK